MLYCRLTVETMPEPGNNFVLAKTKKDTKKKIVGIQEKIIVQRRMHYVSIIPPRKFLEYVLLEVILPMTCCFSMK